jgi:hypothetical protein
VNSGYYTVFTACVYGEQMSVLWEYIGLGTDRATDDIGIILNYTLGDSRQRIRTEVLFNEPSIVLGRSFYRAHIVVDTLDGRFQDAVTALDSFLTDEIARLKI